MPSAPKDKFFREWVSECIKISETNYKIIILAFLIVLSGERDGIDEIKSR